MLRDMRKSMQLAPSPYVTARVYESATVHTAMNANVEIGVPRVRDSTSLLYQCPSVVPRRIVSLE